MYKAPPSCHAATQSSQQHKAKHRALKAHANGMPKPRAPARNNMPARAAKPHNAG